MESNVRGGGVCLTPGGALGGLLGLQDGDSGLYTLGERGDDLVEVLKVGHRVGSLVLYEYSIGPQGGPAGFRVPVSELAQGSREL